jgi:hypothetical protein
MRLNMIVVPALYLRLRGLEAARRDLRRHG